MTTRSAKRDSLSWIGAAMALVCLGLLAYAQRKPFLLGQNDFVQLYAGAQLSGTPRLYEPEASKQVHEQALGGRLEHVYYSRLPFYALFLRPLGALPYRVAYGFFQALSFLAFAGFLWIWVPRRRELLLLISLFLPMWANFLNGQDLAFTVLAAALAVEYLRKNKDFAAGLLLALCAVKFHLFVLTPLVLLIHRRWNALAGGAAAGAALIGLSFAADGLDWPRRYLALLATPGFDHGTDYMPTLRGLLFGLGGTDVPAVMMALSTLVIAGVVFVAWKSDLEFGLAFALVGGLLIGYHAYMHDCMVLLLAYVLVMERSKWVPLRAAVALALTPPLYLFLMEGKPWNVVAPIALIALLGLAAVHPAASVHWSGIEGRRIGRLRPA